MSQPVTGMLPWLEHQRCPVLRWLWSNHNQHGILIVDGRALVAAADDRLTDLLQQSKSYAIHALGIHGTSFDEFIVDCSSEDMQTELRLLWPGLLLILWSTILVNLLIKTIPDKSTPLVI